MNRLAHWSPNEDTPRYGAVDQPANRDAWRRGRKGYWIEPGFRDWKSYGFALERSHLDDPERLQVLLLGIAVTTLWLIHLGEWLTATGRRLLWEASHKCDRSTFRTRDEARPAVFEFIEKVGTIPIDTTWPSAMPRPSITS